MPDWKLKFDDREMTLGTGIVTCGRSTDNSVSFPDDSNVSRYHAEIEERDGEYWLIDLGSSNGTTLNGQKVTREVVLSDGDTVVFGGSSTIEVRFGEEELEENSEGSAADGSAGGSSGFSPNLPASPGFTPSDFGAGSSAIGGTAAAAAPAGSNTTILVAGVVGGLALVCVVAAGAFYLTRGSSCNARAVISKPEAGETITQPVDIEVQSEDAECAGAAVFTLDGNEIARTNEQPFTAKLDPKEFPELADGFEHDLQIVLLDENSEPIQQNGSVLLAFDTRELKKPDPTPGGSTVDTPQVPVGKKGPTIMEIRDMSTQVIKQFPASANYSVSNQQFLQAILKATAEYAQPGYYARAEPYRDAINVAYRQEQGVDAGFGFILAMSRSKFDPAKQGNDEGLWRMSNDFVTTFKYNGLCGTENLSDKAQNCAAKASAVYMKAMLTSVFSGDVIYTAAAFGKSTDDAFKWRDTLPANRADIWNSIRTQQERDQVVRFIAAAIVAENPTRFGLNSDQPLSRLYNVTQ